MALSQYIADNYGSKKGFLRFYKYKALGLLSSKYRSTLPPKGSVKRLVFICSGNICRSAFGEYVSKEQSFPAISFGLHCRGGDPAFKRTLQFARENGYELSSHRSANISEYQAKDGDLLVIMEPAHLKELTDIYHQFNWIYLGSFSDSRATYIHDPYSTNEDYFCRNLRLIRKATENLIESVK